MPEVVHEIGRRVPRGGTASQNCPYCARYICLCPPESFEGHEDSTRGTDEVDE